MSVAEVLGFLRTLVGQPCWRVAFSYGDELYVDFGDRRQYLQGPMAGKECGAYQLYCRESPWVIENAAREIIASATQPTDEVRDAVQILHDQSVMSVTLNESDLAPTLLFERGDSLRILTCPPGAEIDQDELACWELFMPEGRFLEVKPGRYWQLLPYETT